MSIYPQVSFCMTTGRRYDLWKKTMETFTENCLDKDLIHETIIVDDRSPNSELIRMQKVLNDLKYPNIYVIPNTKHGQLNSLQELYKRAEMDFVLHMEDDWRFQIKDHFIRKAFDIMDTDDRIKEVTFRLWECIYVKDGDIEYRMHNYSPMDYKLDWDIIKYNDCTYWGLSFNPSIMHRDTVRKCLEGIEQDSPENRAWDKIVSKRFWDMGYRRANLCEDHLYHIGNRVSYYKRNV